MDEDLIRVSAESLSDRVDDAMADWQDLVIEYKESAFNRLCQEWIDEHSGAPDYHDPGSEASWEAAGIAVDEAVYNELFTNRGWVLRFRAERWYRIWFVVGTVFGLVFGFLIGRLA